MWRNAAQGRSGSVVQKVCLLGVVLACVTPEATQTAVANGDTRSISLYHAHRRDNITITFRRNGSYDSAALRKLNYFLRDWRNDEQIRMDPRLFDVIWEAQRRVGSRGRITVLSSYRSPKTNAMLRSRSRAVAKNSQHMYGRAMDLRIAGANMSRVREVAIQMQRGGVGWYRSRFVHLDVGSVRAWPRMSYSQLARLFPDGKTVHVASDGRTLSGYEEARSMIASRNGSYVPTLAQVREKGFLERLFGWGDSGDEADQSQARRVARRAPLGQTGGPAGEDNSAANFFRRDAARLRGGPRVQVAARTVVKSSARVAPVQPAPKAEAPASRPEAETVTVAGAPVPPRRPSEQKIAALVEHAAGVNEESPVPVPPIRPDNLIVVAENAAPKSAPLPPDSRGRLAALIGLNGAGAIGAKKGLPEVITRGTAVAADASPTGVLAFAAPVGAPSTDPTARQPRLAHVRRLALRRSLPAAPAIARSIGVRAATREAGGNMLIAARFDRSNFFLLTRPESLAAGRATMLMGTALAPLRSAARFNRDALIFAPPALYRATLAGQQKKAAVRSHKRFSALR
ncbi:MAG: DUF882 domain-containing protein [Hyphomicrobiales bacterium]|nr:DUF882 domain-containing protein [Hyphomicrobiales bacterium]